MVEPERLDDSKTIKTVFLVVFTEDITYLSDMQ